MPDYPDRWEFAAGGFVNRDEYLIPEVEQMAYGPVTAYLLRRFGPSEWGGDGYKEIACWYLTTPNPDVVLAVYPVASAMRHGFGYAVNTDRYNNRRDSAQKAEVIEALQAAQKDLLAPVAVRDVLINALGIVPEQDHGDDGPDDDDADPRVVPYFPWAGYGVEHSYFEKEYGSEVDGEAPA
jgi:hypothetical protein